MTNASTQPLATFHASSLPAPRAGAPRPSERKPARASTPSESTRRPITPDPAGKSGGRIWRRLHGGIANAPVYQLWLSAVGLQPQDNTLFTVTYPWLGFRIGVLGNLKPGKR